jgi:uncharacterized LabA/DUF88 family protein
MGDMARYVYIDGESHYIRSQEAWRLIYGKDASLEAIAQKGNPSRDHILVIPKAKVFWVRWTFETGERNVYFTSASADEPAVHDIRIQLRSADLEPYVVAERRKLAAQRQNVLKSTGVIEKAKGVDAALSVRVLEDAYHDNYNECVIYTSDADYLPVIEAVRRRGKRVTVCGYGSGLSTQSPLLYVPDQFVDMEQLLRRNFEPMLPPSGSDELPIKK